MYMCKECNYLLDEEKDSCYCSRARENEGDRRKATELDIAKYLIYYEASDYGLEWDDIKVEVIEERDDYTDAEFEFQFELWGKERNMIIKVIDEDCYVYTPGSEDIYNKCNYWDSTIKEFWKALVE